MTAPAVAAYRFGVACFYGAGLGLLYGFLRPLRARHTGIADTLTVIALLAAWLQLGFGVCQGDLRLGYAAGLFCGAFLWEATAGRALRPVFRGFWSCIGRVLRLAILPFEKIFKKTAENTKILFASWKKWVTIKSNNRRLMRQTGGSHETDTEPNLFRQSGFSQDLCPDEDRGDSGYRIIYGCPSDPPCGH